MWINSKPLLRYAGPVFGAILSLCGSLPISSAEENSPIPPVPQEHLWDESKAVDETTRSLLESILLEHEHLTGQQIRAVILKTTPSPNLEDWTHRALVEWKVGNRGQTNGALIALTVSSRKAQIETGFALESILTPSKITEIVSERVQPEFKRKGPSAAARVAVYSVLEALESPLILSGKIDETLEQNGMPYQLSESTFLLDTWPFFLGLGIFLILIVLVQILSREAHFTSRGWHRAPMLASLLRSYSQKMKALLSRQPAPQFQKLGGHSGQW